MLELGDYALPRILPFGVILLELLFLLTAIPIEAYVLNKRLKFDKKTSMFYSISINLFSSTLGWMLFFFLEPILPINLKSELISYIFFHSIRSGNTRGIMIFTAFMIFFITFFMKFLLLRFFVLSLQESFPKLSDQKSENNRLKWRRTSIARLQNTNLVTTILIANSLSYSSISIIILLSNK
ncbi:filament integrity protein FraC [Nodularia sphaerocarpa]|uniref:filament integrity protein FraC n=1 Tax=Nodularia sphaerocarpa TaxID=137816 RepID=UPI001EFC137E|nr:filament integrity protein FraC [Nodularia sphaerocarpa]MDB9375127.1 filament integrity protein fraC [Nodularia sphaerocarpa CS-585]MDB9379959.1 filament integrity protein fraC [Nodularia sphaerocarpa CS-585A2]ULP73510.1 hypothetical protein BDGGKGIB_03164 [Nodularia sphaerocarpa UHCC 0038]